VLRLRGVRRRAGLLVFLLVPALLARGMSRRVAFDLPLAVLALLFFLPLAARSGLPCPRCGRPFFMKLDAGGGRPWFGNSLARSCRNCGLPLRSPGEHER
jgi:hypothetical protein